MLAHVPGVENPTADYLFCPKIQPQNRIYSKLTDSFTVFHVKIGLASKKPEQEEWKTDYYPHDEAHENIRRN